MKMMLTSLKYQSFLKNPIAMAQVESHWKILATQTKLKFEGLPKTKYQKHLWELVESHKHFLDLGDRSNYLT